MATEKNDPLLGYLLAGRYQVEEFIGEEALGRVYVARKTGGVDRVQVKVLHPHLVENTEAFGRFGREMLATAAIEHPNTVRMVDFGEHRVFHYIVLEHIVGRPLTAEILLRKRLSVSRVGHIGAQLASALAAAHAEGIVHRNLAPSSIVLVDDYDGDYVKIRDFGLAKLTDHAQQDEAALTAAGERIGNIAYMAPEYIQNNTVSAKMDLYSLGCVLYEMLTGRTPFVGGELALMQQHIDAKPVPPSEYVAEIPKWMDALVLRLLAKNPEQRPGDGSEVVKLLETQLGRSLAPPPRTGAKAGPPPIIPDSAPPTLEPERAMSQADLEPVAPTGQSSAINPVAAVVGIGTAGFLLVSIVAIAVVLLGWFGR